MENAQPPAQDIATTLRLYTRLCPGRKALFVPTDTTYARYFVTNPVPHKHSAQWKPVFYRGDNPKYCPGTLSIGYARRAAMWSSFSVWLGDGVHEVLENKRRREFKKKVERKAKWRKTFGMKEKPPNGVIEDEQEVTGKVELIKMSRAGVTRRVEFKVDEEWYRWSGTRTLGGGMGVKGMSHSMKLVRKSDKALIATFAKDRWAGYKRSIKSGPPNKKKRYIGQLQIYDAATIGRSTTDAQGNGGNSSRVADVTGRIDEFSGGMGKYKNKKVNPSGTHTGNYLEEMIAFSCWMVAEAEHRLRYKIFDLLEEAGENAGG